MKSTLSAYVVSGTPRTTSLTPIWTVTNSGRSESSEGSSWRIRSSLLKPFVARLPARVSSAGRRSTSCCGQLSAGETDVPIVYESPRAT